ncbi:hypothetical protein AB0F88_17330 [Streptosporangium sp. NPDC023963]|uniref:hypothetical protein n=1 Tax=Streptosporangium sp. NPDC023963 TaxID=3155608 RepID=UPI0034460D9B
MNATSGRADAAGPLYTLAGAQIELNRLECVRHGHDLDLIVGGASGDPVAAFCSRPCGHPGWVMVRADQPHLWRSLTPVLIRALAPYPSALDAANAAINAAMTPAAAPMENAR